MNAPTNANTDEPLKSKVFRTMAQFLNSPDADMAYKMYKHCALLYSSGDYVFDPEVCLFQDYEPPSAVPVDEEVGDETTEANAEPTDELDDDAETDDDSPDDDGKTARDKWVNMAVDSGLSEATADIVRDYGFDNVANPLTDNIQLIGYFTPYTQALTVYWNALSLTPETDKTAVAYMPSTPAALIGFCSVIIGKYGDTFALLENNDATSAPGVFGGNFPFTGNGTF